MDETLTLYQLNELVRSLVSVPSTQGRWVIAELSDVNVRGGHCYMELLQKDDAGRQVAKARGVIWANRYQAISYDFLRATGQQFATGLKVRLRVSVSMHSVYGMSLVISEVDPSFTMGDLLRRRNESINKLRQLGILDANRQLQLPDFPSRIAIISAPTAAGYGDFMKQLYGNKSSLRFVTTLFPAIVQGDRAPASIIEALEMVAERSGDFDCVVII
ncbi:MAG: exodeoxyribonuclease VII large subunit, partial [Muribaculaceae bacterium]|nr:exodeoxyribonuclease VII large subunit [Muribaculaceae bacterium]